MTKQEEVMFSKLGENEKEWNEHKRLSGQIAFMFILLEIFAGLGVGLVLHKFIGSEYNTLIIFICIGITFVFTKFLIEIHGIVISSDLRARIENT